MMERTQVNLLERVCRDLAELEVQIETIAFEPGNPKLDAWSVSAALRDLKGIADDLRSIVAGEE